MRYKNTAIACHGDRVGSDVVHSVHRWVWCVLLVGINAVAPVVDIVFTNELDSSFRLQTTEVRGKLCL
jgi:hypothetical protein